MKSAQHEPPEQPRISALEKVGILDTPKEERIDNITSFAAGLFSVKYSGLGFIDSNRVWFKSMYGLRAENFERGNELFDGFLSTTDILVINDASSVEEYSQNSLITKDPYFKFFAGIPIKTSDGFVLGVFFIADPRPKNFESSDIELFKSISRWMSFEVNNSGKADSFDYEKAQEIQKELTVKNRQLAEEKARHDAMLDNIGEGVVGINDKGEIEFINKQVEILTGFSESDLLGKLLVHVMKMVDESGKEIEPNNRPIRTAIFTKKKIYNSKYFYIKKDGNRLPTAVTATPVELYGQVIGGVNVFRDVTKEREVDRMKTEFISLASHQLRTPLSAMKWFSEMLLDGDVGDLMPEQKELINNIYQSNERMIELVNSLLNISRIESGRIIIDPKPTDLRKLVDEVLLELRKKIENKNLNLVVSVHDKLPLINVDPKLVRHIYMNLLTNAIKYSPMNSEIGVFISRSDSEIISQITDNGYGIPKAQHNKVSSRKIICQNTRITS